MEEWIEVESLYVVSDLHLGGGEGFQIFGSTPELVWLIDTVARASERDRRALLINGDFVDFLAESPGAYFDCERAVAKLDDIIKRFEPVFAALQRLLATPDCRLIINLGNHDLELSLPWVRAHLTRRLALDDTAAAARLIWVTDGTGVRCRLGAVSVVCVHGNEVDSWNVTDYERLRRIGRDVQFGKAVETWVPCAGTQLVIEVMNQIKKQYPFVDLLKPETEAVLPILAALNPGIQRKLFELAGVASRKAWDMTRMRAGFLDADPSQAAPDVGYRPPPQFPALSAPRTSDDLMRVVEVAWVNRIEPLALVRGVQAEQLGFWSAMATLVAGKPKHEVLRAALDSLDKDDSFNPASPDATFHDLDEMVGSDVDLIVAGHTHLERSIPRRQGRGHYFNSGTWARLIKIEKDVRQNPAAFEEIFRILSGSQMPALDKAQIVVNGEKTPVVFRRNTVVAIEAKDGGRSVHATLRHVVLAEDGSGISFVAADAAAEWTGS
jgi:UDP-2,3-diacylglucosamine pyrophosphatase LpxH